MVVASIAVGIVPLIILERCYGVPRKLMLGYGFLAWIVGVTGLKMPLYHFFVVPVLHRLLSPAWLGVVQGVISAATELGAAALFFLFVVPNLSFTELIGFGCAAGSLEAIILPAIPTAFRGTPLKGHAAKVLATQGTSMLMPWLDVLERALASVVHLSTRGLVYVGMKTASAIPIVIAVGTFAAIDGVVYYGHLRKWRFEDASVLARFYTFLAAVALIQALSFVGFYRRGLGG
jgi:hypothetical protein